MRVLQVIYGLAPRQGGAAAFVLEASLALEDIGVNSVVFATDMARPPGARPFERVNSTDIPTESERLDISLFPARRPYRLAFSPALDAAIKRGIASFDLVHIHMLWLFPSFAAFHRAKASNTRYVVSLHGNLDPYLARRGRLRKRVTNAAWQRRMLEGASAVHTTTVEEARAVAHLAPVVTPTVVPGAIQWSAFQDLPDGRLFLEKYLGGHAGPLILYLGRLSYTKGLDILIEAFARVARVVPDCRLAIVGPDDEGLRPVLAALAESEGVAPRVHFIGPLYGSERLTALAAADVWASPARSESFGLALLEALAAGLPVVISPDVRIAGEIQAADAAAVADLNPDSFAAQLVRTLQEMPYRTLLGARARDFAKRYDRSELGPRLAEMYARVLAD
jgi:glycosyltransferase involved in cell wall biosynthesis